VTQYLLPEQVLFLHSRLVEETGGAHGVRDLGMLLSAFGHPQSTFDNQELTPDLFAKTAALMDSLVRNHPFVDGNKRTAIAAADIFLWINQVQLMVRNEEMVRFTLACAQSQLSISEMVEWFIRYSIPVTGSFQP
jgi:death on curing protein